MIYSYSFDQVIWQTVNNFDYTFNNLDYIFKVRCSKLYDSIQDIYHEVLSTEEIVKSKRFRHIADYKRFVCSRYCLRKILASFLGIFPQDLVFEYGEHKKPMIDGMEFNVSHSGDVVLLAISQNPVGIDVEEINTLLDFESFTANSFTSTELDFIKNSVVKNVSFYQIWTRKEALLKATGEGLVDEMNQIDVLDSNIIRFNKNYNLFSFNINEEYVACFAALKVNQISFFDYH